MNRDKVTKKMNSTGKLEEELLLFVTISEIRTGEGIFSALETRLQIYGLLWERCISICTDEAAAMEGKHKGVLAKVF